VRRENLPALVRALDDNKYRLSVYVKGTRHTFFKELAEIFHRSRDAGAAGGPDVVAVQHIGRIVHGLLSPPFNSDNAIVGMLVDDNAIDDTIDIVQCFFGRADAASGFVSTSRRRAAFRNPARLPPRYVQQVHFLFALQYLRDLLPLLLDDGGEAAGVSGLVVYMLKLRYALLHDVAADVEFLPATFAATPFAAAAPSVSAAVAESGVGSEHGADATVRGSAPDVVDAAELVAMLHELSTSAKASPLPLEAKEELFRCLVDRGTLPFLGRVYSKCVFGSGGEVVAEELTVRKDGIAEAQRWATASRRRRQRWMRERRRSGRHAQQQQQQAAPHRPCRCYAVSCWVCCALRLAPSRRRCTTRRWRSV
jgi:hypothetical protein